MVVYEVNVREFNQDFDGVITQLDYIHSLGVNVLELMPVTNVKEVAEWGYTPIDYFAPDERLGGPVGDEAARRCLSRERSRCDRRRRSMRTRIPNFRTSWFTLLQANQTL